MELTKLEKLDDLKNIAQGNEMLLIHSGPVPEANYAVYGILKQISDSVLITLKDSLTLHKEGFLYGNSGVHELVDADFSDPYKLAAVFMVSELELNPASPTYSLARFDNWEIYCINDS